MKISVWFLISSSAEVVKFFQKEIYYGPFIYYVFIRTWHYKSSFIFTKIIKNIKKKVVKFFQKKNFIRKFICKNYKKNIFLKIFQKKWWFFTVIGQKLIYSPELTRRDHIFLKLFFIEYFGVWVLYFPKLPEKSSFYVVDLTKFARKIPLKVRFFALKLHNFIFIASQVSCNVQMLHPG